MTTAELAALFHVTPTTVTRWAIKRRLSSIRTPGGHRRYFRNEALRWFDETRINRKGT